MNVIFSFIRRYLVVLALGSAMVASQAEARDRGGYGQLIVQRAANFGTYISLQMWIDGVEVRDISRGRRYNRVIPPGRHVLTVTSVPNTRRLPPTSTFVNVRPGQTYVFTAMWDPVWGVVLRPSTLAS